jgi:hypothetical protein
MVFMEQQVRFLNKASGFIFLLFIIAGCGYDNKENFALQKPGRVPPIYYAISNPAFSNKQDTILFNGRLFSGYAFYLYSNGDTAFISGYLNGLKEGTARQWYPGKVLKEERTYVNGFKEGIHKGWWISGKPQFMFQVSRDEYTGLLMQWYVSGHLERIFHYKNGREQGSENFWWPDGKIRANYVIVDGEKFGLFGQKLCVNKNFKQQIN